MILARRKLQHYFLGHAITVVSSFLLGEIIKNREATERIAMWSVELMGETLTYAPRKAIKSQALVDFIVEWTDTQLPPGSGPSVTLDDVLRWVTHEDRSWGRPTIHLTSRRPHEVCHPNTFCRV